VKQKILVVVQEYPQVSETYIKNELDALEKSYDLELLALMPGNCPYRSRRPHIVLSQANQTNVVDYLKRFGPAIIHAHYLAILGIVFEIARRLNVPFTIRAHSFDVLGSDLAKMNLRAIGSSPLFRGVLCFPFMRQRLIDAGLPERKVFACNPVIDVLRFRDLAPNGADIMNVGAALPKKNMEDFIALSKLVPERTFNLYGLGYDTPRLMEVNAGMGGRVTFVPPVDPEDMPGEYKKHCWLVYTASRTINTVGWPMALIEAQASGVGVCVQRIREDLRDYVGDAGSFFEAPEDLVDVLRTNPPETMRKAGFEWASQFDYRLQLHVLTDLWH
jgi:glycosyltransferase involved in cell wall biosynthesis